MGVQLKGLDELKRALKDNCNLDDVKRVVQTNGDRLNRTMKEGFEDAMKAMVLPKHLRKLFRTSNHIERLNKELKHRSKVIGIFPNADSLNRLMGSVLMEINEKRKDSTFKDVHEYATNLGEALSAPFQKNITEKVLPEGVMYFNIAERAIWPFLEEIYREVLQEAAAVQKKLNSKVGIGMTSIIPEIDEDRIKGIIDKLSNGELY